MTTDVPTQRLGQDLSLDAQLLDIFFDRVPMGIAVFGRDLRLQRCNKTWAGFFHEYMGAPPDYVQPGRTIHELIPHNAAELAPLIDAAMAGLTFRQDAHRLSLGDVTTYWDVVIAPTFADGEVVGFVDIVTDATQRVLAFELLERRIRASATIAASMTVDQPIDTTLQALASTAREVTGAVACAVLVVDAASDEISVFASDGLPSGYGQALTEGWREGVGFARRTAALTQHFTLIPNAVALGLQDPDFAAWHEHLRRADWRDLVVVPLATRGRDVGLMQYHHRGGHVVDDDERTFLTALADQAAVAVVNAELYRSSEQHATLLERQRLARELHDSVSQALFSMTLHTRTAERHLARAGLGQEHPAVGEVQRLQALTQGALAEMRALIFELRPGALQEEGLVGALQRQAAALTARVGLPAVVTGPAARLPLTAAAEEHLYRLALEALNNSVKHAQGTGVTVSVELDETTVTLRVADDGQGFDPSRPTPGHLGQTTMRERAAAAGGTLDVTSVPGAGCVVTARVPVCVRHPADADPA